MQHAGIKNMFKDELFSRVRARRDSDDDDVGLPHSPCTSPTTVDVLTQGLKPKSLKSQTTCSAGSLISMCSSENDEDSALASSSGHSSRMSLLDRRSIDFEGDPDLCQSVPLNHQAARHRIAVRPKRTHGLPQKRLKQLAASKLSTLPATPEVTEYLKTETTTTTITSTSSMHQINKFVTSRETTVQNISEKMSSEFSQFSPDKPESHLPKLSPSDSHLFQNNFDTNKDTNINEQTSIHDNYQESHVKINSVSDQAAIDQHYLSMEIHQSLLQTAEHMKHSAAHKNNGEENLQDFEETFSLRTTASENNTSQSLQQVNDAKHDVSLRVSALIKNIEQSSDGNVKSKAKPEQNNLKVGKGDTNLPETSNHSEIKSPDKSETNHDIPANRPFDLGSRLSNICLGDFKSNKFIVNSNNTNMPSENSYDSKILSQEQSKMEQEIRQQFQQQKVVTKRNKPNGTVSNLCPEEESIMSNKCVSSPTHEKSLMHESSKVSVSHHVSYDSVTQHETIIEARNLVTVDETFNLNVRGYSENNTIEALKSNESWVRSLDVSSLDNEKSNVSIDSVTSNICNQKTTDDRVTISVNSNNSESNTSETLQNESVKITTDKTPKTTKKPSVQNLKPKPDERTKKVDGKKATSTPESHPKPPLKTNTSAKKVSVEIVPFSQRMKEKKYQPLAFSNKNTTHESSKPNSNVVERNLSERRINPKGKDSEKGNNRHSFSGALPAEIERHIISSSTEKKSLGKLDKLHYPVQIRIHKGKVDEKENKCENQHKSINDLKNDQLKSQKELKSDVPTKWEVKVQSSSHAKENLLSQTEIRKALSESKSIINKTVQNDDSQDIPSDVQADNSLEDASARNKDTPRKPVKESSSKESEPELLRVFARRSIKQKHCDKENPNNKVNSANEDQVSDNSSKPNETSKPSDSAPPPVTNSISKTVNVEELPTNTSPDIVRKISKSFSEKEKSNTLVSTSVKDASIIRRPSLKAVSSEVSDVENFHRRQRTASEPEVPVLLPSDSINCLKTYQNNSLDKSMLLTCRSDHLQRTSSLSISPSATLSNGTSHSIRSELDKNKDNTDPSAPSWLQLAQQRRELREQRERLLLGSTTNSYLDASSKPSRSSKVWDMVNNFQKLQMT